LCCPDNGAAVQLSYKSAADKGAVVQWWGLCAHCVPKEGGLCGAGVPVGGVLRQKQRSARHGSGLLTNLHYKKWPQMTKSGLKSQKVASNYKKVATNDKKWPQITKSCLKLQKVASNYKKVATNDKKWPQITKSGLKLQKSGHK
jgi:hypothetical protein